MSDTAVQEQPLNEISQAASQSSTLGGPKAIQERFKSFVAAESNSSTETTTVKETPQKPAKTPAKATVEKVEKAESILPPEEGVETQSTDKSKETTQDPSKEKKGSDGMNATERKEFLELKAKAERAVELEQKVKDGEATLKQYEELRGLHADLEERYKLVEAKATAFDVRNSPQFKATVSEPLGILVKGVEDLCSKVNLKPAEVFDAIWDEDEIKGNTKLSEFLGSMDSVTARKFERMVDDMRITAAKGDKLLASAPEAWTAIQADQKKAEEAKAVKEKETYKIANEAIFNEMKQRFPFLAEEEVADKVIKGALELDFRAMSPDKLAFYAQAGMASLHFNKVLKAKDAEIASLKSALQKDKPSGPGDGAPHKEESQETVDEKQYEGMTTGQRMAQFLKNQGK